MKNYLKPLLVIAFLFLAEQVLFGATQYQGPNTEVIKSTVLKYCKLAIDLGTIVIAIVSGLTAAKHIGKSSPEAPWMIVATVVAVVFAGGLSVYLGTI